MKGKYKKNRKYNKKRKVLNNPLVVSGYKKYNTGCILGGTVSFPFPPRLRTLFRTVITGGISVPTGSAGNTGNDQDIYFKLNALTFVGPSDNYPLGNTTSFGNNVPAGLSYLLSSFGALTGSFAPYNKYIVKKSSIRFEFSTEGTSNKATEIIVLPISANPTVTATTIVGNTIAEQPFAKTIVAPPVLNERIKPITHSISVAKLFGVKALAPQDEDYVGIGNAQPNNVASWQVRIRNLDNSTTARVGSYKCTIIHDAELFDLNYFSSSIPN